MRNRTKIFMGLIIAIIAGVIIVLVRGDENQSPLEYIKKDSYHSEFKITKNNEVIITEEIHIQNCSNDLQNFRVIGIYSEDFNQGLLTTEKLNGYIGNRKQEVLELGANQEKTFKINFIGNKGSINTKQDRNQLEDIVFEIIE
ncbi:hypothetical protein [Paenibacillus sp. FSL R5-0701]|uniref:hypothetical protein n=1 Tax=Paenibacillus sp. FSL R5-0701 TaxID=2921654 RepID=UPI0030D06580